VDTGTKWRYHNTEKDDGGKAMKMQYYAKSPVFGRDGRFDQIIDMTEDIREVENQVINLYPEITYEKFEGFGGAITEAAAYIYSLMNEEEKKQVIETYFSPEQMNY
jgi:glucosylceramidase